MSLPSPTVLRICRFLDMKIREWVNHLLVKDTASATAVNIAAISRPTANPCNRCFHTGVKHCFLTKRRSYMKKIWTTIAIGSLLVWAHRPIVFVKEFRCIDIRTDVDGAGRMYRRHGAHLRMSDYRSIRFCTNQKIAEASVNQGLQRWYVFGLRKREIRLSSILVMQYATMVGSYRAGAAWFHTVCFNWEIHFCFEVRNSTFFYRAQTNWQSYLSSEQTR